MKRACGGGDSGRTKRPKHYGLSDAIAMGKYELRILVGSKCAGAVIGRGGENIKRLRAEYDGQVSIPDSNTPERIVTITGTVDVVVNMVEDMLVRLDEVNKPGQREIKLLVHQSHAGALIGHLGVKIKELRLKTSSQIKIYQNPCPQSTDRVVLVSGDDPNIVGAVRTIIEELKEVPIKGGSSLYSTFNYDPYTVEEYGGFSANGFTPIPAGRGRGSRGGAMREFGAGAPGDAMQHMVRVRVNSHLSGGMTSMTTPSIGIPSPLPYMGGMRPGGFAMGGQNYGGGQPTYGSAGYGMPVGTMITTQQVTIPSVLAGTIIGRRGERMSQIMADSGADIMLEPPNERLERIIAISGTENQINAAQYLLQQAVRLSAEGQRYYSQNR